MNFDAKIEELKEIKNEIDKLSEIISEIKSCSRSKDKYEKSEDKHIYLYRVGIFVKLFRFFGISKYKTTSGGHLTNYSEFDYKTDMMNEILEIVEKYKNKTIKELESKFSN